MEFNYSKYKKAAVIGAARSGIAAAKLLSKKGIDVLLSDSGKEDKINPVFLKEISGHGIKSEFGKHSDEIYKCDLVVVSPGVPQEAEVIQTAAAKGLDLVSEIELASWFCAGKIISITGTNGKTTTTTLTGEIFREAGLKSYVCGNIGTAFCDVTELISEDGYAIVETSSFQLDNIKNFKPLIALLLNITPDHLDRYNQSMEAYTRSKNRIYENQDENDYFIYNYDDAAIHKSLSADIKSKNGAFSSSNGVKKAVQLGSFLDNNKLVYYYDRGEEIIIDTRMLIIKGMHNIYNSMASVITARLAGIDKQTIQKTLESFKGVEHRLEFVRELNGIKFYNDSKATNVNSVWYALRGFNERIILILGGRDKGNDYSEIENEVKNFVKHIIAVGESKQKVYDFFSSMLPVSMASDMEDAVLKAVNAAEKNEIVLLSPACASFDMFENYEHRGKEFKKAVMSL